MDLQTVGRIVSWWMLAPFIGFFVGMIVGRHFYPALARRFGVASSEGPLLEIDRSGRFPRIVPGPNTTSGELVGTLAVYAISCYMAFSAGASNVANAVAPLVSSGAVGTDAAILVAAAAIGFGAFTIARRTMESVGTELTDISLFAALIVMLTAATITTGLSWMGIPISLVMGTVTTIAGLGWGRATRPISLGDAVRGSVAGEMEGEIVLDAVAAEAEEVVASEAHDAVAREAEDAVTAEPGAPVREIDEAEQTVADEAEQAVAREVDEQVSREVAEELGTRLPAEVAAEVRRQVTDEIAGEIEERVSEEVARQVDRALADRLADGGDEADRREETSDERP